MKANISQALITALGSQDLTDFDTQQRGLMLRLRASGVHSYRVDVGRGRVLTLGAPSDALTPTVAPAMASAKLGEQHKFAMGLGPDPMAVARRKKAASLKTFLDEHYAPWAVGQLKHQAALLSRIHSQFLDLFGAKPLTEITPFAVERWRTARLKGADAVTNATANRDLAALKACLSKAVQWGILADQPAATRAFGLRAHVALQQPGPREHDRGNRETGQPTRDGPRCSTAGGRGGDCATARHETEHTMRP